MKDVITAVAKAMGEVKRLAKDSRNAEQKYDFASVDDFLAMTGPIMAANGLVTVMTEAAVEPFERQGKYGTTSWLQIAFDITTYHVSGENLPTVRRTVEVIRTGAQSYGSAQSYVLKQYQRALFCIPTGDNDDADFAAKGEGAVAPKETIASGALRDAWRDAVEDSLPEDATPRQRAEAYAEAIIADFKSVKKRDTLDGRWSRHEKMIVAFAERQPDLHKQIVEAYENHPAFTE